MPNKFREFEMTPDIMLVGNKNVKKEKLPGSGKPETQCEVATIRAIAVPIC